jgi:hypothetical protein
VDTLIEVLRATSEAPVSELFFPCQERGVGHEPADAGRRALERLLTTHRCPTGGGRSLGTESG